MFLRFQLLGLPCTYVDVHLVLLVWIERHCGCSILSLEVDVKSLEEVCRRKAGVSMRYLESKYCDSKIVVVVVKGTQTLGINWAAKLSL
jgi:hypothetical protein